MRGGLASLAAILLATSAAASPIDLPSPWVAGGAKVYDMRIEQRADSPLRSDSVVVSSSVEIRVVQRKDNLSRLSWKFGAAHVERNGCFPVDDEATAVLADGAVRPGFEIEVEDSGTILKMHKAPELRAAWKALLKSRPARASEGCPPIDERALTGLLGSAEYDSHGSASLAGREAKLFVGSVGIPLDARKPYTYDDYIDFVFFDPEVYAPSTWRVVKVDAERNAVDATWTRKMNGERSAKTLAEATEQLVSVEILSPAEVLLPKPVDASEKSDVSYDRHTGWPRSLRYERIIRLGTMNLATVIVFNAK